MASTNRTGRVSAIDYEAGTYEVTYFDRGKSVTRQINAMSNGEYKMPCVGQVVSVAHNSNGTAAGTTTGTVWNKTNKPAEGYKGLYRKEERTMENPITRAEHEEFRRRLEEENKRQDARIGILEESVQQIGALATSVEKLAVSMQSMLKEQEKQGKRLEALEGRDGEKWRKVMGYIATAIVGIVLGYLFKRIGM